MIVTVEWMEEWFRRFDHDYFGGKLPVPVHPKFIQMDGYTTLMFEVDEEALAD